MIDVSIITVNWNTKDYLLEFLQSLVKGIKLHNKEIIVVDNGSTDGSPEAVKKYYPDVNLIVNNKNLGFSKANNIGIKRCKGRYVCLVNSDIKVLDNCIDLMCSYMDKCPKVGILGPKTFNIDFTLQHTCREFPTLWGFFCQAAGLTKIFQKSRLFKDSFMTYFDHDSINSVETLSGCFLMIRKVALDKVGLFDENFYIYGEDVDLCKRFKNTGWDIVFFPEAKVIHYGGVSSSAAPIKFALEMLKANLQYWEKYHNKFSQLIYLIICIYHSAIRIIEFFSLFLLNSSRRTECKNKMKENIAKVQWILKNKIIWKK